MDEKEQITQLLASVAGILEDGMAKMGKKYHFVIITNYPDTVSKDACSFISDIEGHDLEALLIGAVIASRDGDVSYLEKDKHIQ